MKLRELVATNCFFALMLFNAAASGLAQEAVRLSYTASRETRREQQKDGNKENWTRYPRWRRND